RVSEERLSSKYGRFLQRRHGHTACPYDGHIVGLITAGRRECWGSQTDGAGGHRNSAVPFCFVRGIESRPMRPRFYLLLAATVAAAFGVHVRVPVHADARHSPSLTTLVGKNGLTRDTNGDGIPDSVAARIVIPASAPLADIEAAANLAARLGYDTTALSLPLVVRDADVTQAAAIAAPILVGRDNRFTKMLIDAHAIDVGGLALG